MNSDKSIAHETLTALGTLNLLSVRAGSSCGSSSGGRICNGQSQQGREDDEKQLHCG